MNDEEAKSTTIEREVRSKPTVLKRLYRSIRKRVLAHFWQKRIAHTVRSDYGLLLAPNWNDATFRYYVFANYGYYYSNYLKSLDHPFNFFDIGANQGLYSLLAAQNKFCVTVHAFEPMAVVSEFIKTNARLNSIKNIKVHVVAVSSNEGEKHAIINTKHTGGTRLSQGYPFIDKKPSADTTIQVEKVDCISTRQLNLLLEESPLPVHVKIDVEGHENEVFDALIKCDQFSKIKSILYEVDEQWIDHMSIKARLIDNGFRDFTRIGKGTHYDILARRTSDRISRKPNSKRS